MQDGSVSHDPALDCSDQDQQQDSTELPFSRFRHQPKAVESQPEYDVDLLSKDRTTQKNAIKKYLAAKIRSDWEFKRSRPVRPTHAPQSRSQHLESSATKNTSSNPDCLDPDTDPQESRDVAADPKPNTKDDDETAADEPDSESGDEGDEDHDMESIYSIVSEDPDHFTSRLEWSSELSGDDEDSASSPSAYRFESPETVGAALKVRIFAKQAQRQRKIRTEEKWNEGLAYFNLRRNAWTGAKVVRVKPQQPPSNRSPTNAWSPSTRRLSFWKLSSNRSSSISSSSPPSPKKMSNETAHSGSSSDFTSRETNPSRSSTLSSWPVRTLIPIPPPIIPPANPMRASISPLTYYNIYDKIVTQSLAPACPINLSDMLRACVAGWKRDGDWPPRTTPISAAPVETHLIPPPAGVRKKRSSTFHTASNTNGRVNPPSSNRRLSFGFRSGGRRDSAPQSSDYAMAADNDGAHVEDTAAGSKGIRKSLQKALGLGHAPGPNHGPPDREGKNATGNSTAISVII